MPGPNEGQPSFQEILQFDPFAGESGTPDGDSTPPATEEQPPAEVEEPAEGGQAVPPATPAPATPPAPAQPAMTAAQMADLIRQQASATADAVRSALPQPQQTPQQTPPRFNLGVPDELVTALKSEDPAQFKAGIGALINGISNHIWTSFQQSMQQEFAPAVRSMVEQMSSASRQQDNVAQDFYGTYPMFQNPLMTQMVQMAGQMVGQEWQQQGKPLAWGPELRDAIAERVFQAVPQLRQQAAPAQAKPRANGRFATGGGTRPEPAQGPQQEMLDVIFGPRTQ